VHKIRQKILLITLIPSMFMLGILSAYLLHTRSHDLEEQFRERGNAVARQLAAAALNGILNNRQDILELLGQEVLKTDPEVQKIRFTNPHGLVLAEAENASRRYDAPGLDNHFVSQIAPAYDVKGIYQYVLEQPVHPNSEGKIQLGEVSIWLDPRQLVGKQQEIVANTVVLALTGLLAIALLSVFLSQRIAHPLEELTQAARELRKGKLDIRVPLDESGEVGELQKAFNEMAQEISAASETLHAQIDQATQELQESMEILEIKNVELDLARKKALQANRVKSEFLASMSHEIRTPMNGILGFTNLLRRTSLNKVQLEYLETIETSAGTLLAIINDILDLSRLEAGKLNLEHAPFSLRQCIDDTVSLLAPMAHQKRLELVSFVYDDVPDRLLGDRTRIAQIVTNLVNNAIKFTQKGEVVLRISLEEEKDHSIGLALTVTDTGIGIPEEEQEHIFDTFVQGQVSQDHAAGGTGLGLSICRRLAESMDGGITLSSKPGKGSTFTCILRLDRDLESPEATAEEPLFKGRSVCLLEPHPVSRQAITGVLAGLGIGVKAPQTPPDLSSMENCAGASCDTMLICLGSTQLEDPLLQERVARQLLEPGPPIGLLLGSSSQELMDSFLDKGALFCLSKPARRSALRQGLVELFTPRTKKKEKSLPAPSAAEPEVSRERSSWLSGKRILIADDNAINRKLVEILLTDLGATVLSASDGRAAIDTASAESLDLVILDIHMPNLNGFEAATAIRQLPGRERLPIVAMTADAMSRNRQQIDRSDFSAYILKPIEEQELRMVLRDTLFGTEVVLHPGLNESKPLAAPPPEPTRESPPLRDEAQALRITGGSKSIAENLFSQFLDSLPTETKTIGELLEAEQWAELWQAVHHLQGAVAVCGVPAFAAALKQLQSCVSEEDREAAAEAYERILVEQRRLLKLKPLESISLQHHA